MKVESSKSSVAIITESRYQTRHSILTTKWEFRHCTRPTTKKGETQNNDTYELEHKINSENNIVQLIR